VTSRILGAGTLWELIERRAAASGPAVMLRDEAGRQVSFADYRDRCELVAAALAEHGVGPSSRVAWQLPTRISTFLVLGALARLGATQAPVITLYRERETAAAVTTAACELMLVPGTWRGTDHEAMARAIDPPPDVLVVGEEPPERDAVNALPPPPTDPDAVRWVFFTSGSTGAPKGARHTDRGLITAGEGFALRGRLGDRPDEVGAIGFPVGHIGGTQFLIAMLSGGFGSVLIEQFVPGPAAELMRAHRVTVTGGSTVFYTALLTEQRRRPGDPLIPTLRVLKGGGAPCPAELFHAVRAELGVTIAHDYGMTEAPMIAVADPTDDPAILARTDGAPIPGVEIRLTGPDGAAVPAGGEGEVQLRGAVVFQGYTDPALDAEVFNPDGWLRTGDLGRLHPTGHLEVTGRLKDVIIRKGENLAPQEVEELLAGHPAIAEIAALGLPDPALGERMCVVLAPAPGHTAPGLAEITSFLTAAGLMRQKIPEQIEVVRALPRTGLGKVAKQALRKAYTRPEG
jgi:acyl-CoA synthetase (AMP-forming)/AMP-acid ligase II